jgi:hypothetical protein
MDEEEALVRSFIVRPKRDRWVALLANPRRRRAITVTLAHLRDLDPRWRVRLPSDRDGVASVEHELLARGAGPTCHLVSESRALDGRRLPLPEALGAVIGSSVGTLISCVPGTLAFYEGEDPEERVLLHRRVPAPPGARPASGAADS